LHDFKQAYQGNGDRRNSPASLRIGEPEQNPDQKEGERVIAMLSENRVRPNDLRSERYESDSSREQPRDEPKKSGNNH
jgi:hypothetical protein